MPSTTLRVGHLGNRSYLGTPGGYFESNNNIPPGWLFLFTREDFRVGYARDDRPDADEWTWPLSKEDGEEGTGLHCSTTVRKALDNLGRKTAAARSPYIRGFFPGLDTLKGYLERSPPDGKVQLDLTEYTWFYNSMMEASSSVFKLLDMLDTSLATDDTTLFIEFFHETAGARLTGDLAFDMAQTLEARHGKLEDWMLGAAWPASDGKKDDGQ